MNRADLGVRSPLRLVIQLSMPTRSSGMPLRQLPACTGPDLFGLRKTRLQGNSRDHSPIGPVRKTSPISSDADRPACAGVAQAHAEDRELLRAPATTAIADLAPQMTCRRCGPNAPRPTLSAASAFVRPRQAHAVPVLAPLGIARDYAGV